MPAAVGLNRCGAASWDSARPRAGYGVRICCQCQGAHNSEHVGGVRGIDRYKESSVALIDCCVKREEDLKLNTGKVCPTFASFVRAVTKLVPQIGEVTEP